MGEQRGRGEQQGGQERGSGVRLSVADVRHDDSHREEPAALENGPQAAPDVARTPARAGLTAVCGGVHWQLQQKG